MAKQEALQFDIPCDTSIYKSTYLDGTTMKNVEVTNCLFQNVPRGVGTHTLLNGAYHENIKITGNIFKNIQEEAIIALTYYNCEIKNNVIENCGGGVLIQYFKPLSSSVMKYAELKFTAEKLVLQKKIRKIKQSRKKIIILVE